MFIECHRWGRRRFVSAHRRRSRLGRSQLHRLTETAHAQHTQLRLFTQQLLQHRLHFLRGDQLCGVLINLLDEPITIRRCSAQGAEVLLIGISLCATLQFQPSTLSLSTTTFGHLPVTLLLGQAHAQGVANQQNIEHPEQAQRHAIRQPALTRGHSLPAL